MSVNPKIEIDPKLLEQLRQYDPRPTGQINFDRSDVVAIIFWMIKWQIPLSSSILARAGKKAIYKWIYREWGSFKVGVGALYLEFVRSGQSWRGFRTMAEDKINERMRRLTRHGMVKPSVGSIAMRGDFRLLQTLCHKYADQSDPVEAALRDWAILQNDARRVRRRLPQGLWSDSIDQFIPEVKTLAKQYQLDVGELTRSLRAATCGMSHFRVATANNLLVLADCQLPQLRPGSQLDPKRMAVALPGAEQAITANFRSVEALEAAARLLDRIRNHQPPR